MMRRPKRTIGDVLNMIIVQCQAWGHTTPYKVSRAMGYHLSGSISMRLKNLEADGLIKRVYRTANEVEIYYTGAGNATGAENPVV